MSHKLIIVEDEPIIAFDLKLCAEQAGYEVLGTAATASDAFLLIEKVIPDLVLLDIKIKGEADGVSVARYLNEKKIPFVFITSSYDHHTLERVKQVNPAAYILKPFRDDEVIANIHLAIKKNSGKTSPTTSSKLFVRDGGVLKPIKIEDLLFVKGESNYSILFMRDEKTFTLTHTLKSIEEKLPVSNFCRVHKSYLINIEFIDLIEHSIVMIGKHTIPIGKSNRANLFEKMQVL